VFVFGNLLGAIAGLLDVVFSVYTWILIINVILSWIRLDPYHPVVSALTRISNLICDPIRRVIPMGNMGLDFSPLIAILLLQFGGTFITRTLREIAQQM
jgi:YggT family protein